MKAREKIKELGQLQLFLLFIVLLLFIIPYTYKAINRTKFNSEEWKAELYNETEWSSKWEMCKDLLREYELGGMSKSEIINLLGEPSTETTSSMSYNLGPTGRGINYGTLTLIIENNVVKEIRVNQG